MDKMNNKESNNDFIPDDVDIEIVYKELCLNLEHQGYYGASEIARISELMTRLLIKGGIL